MTESGNERHARDDTSFIAFYDVAVGEIFRYFNRATAGDRALAEDLTQETFLAAVKAYKNGQADAFTMPWIITVARNKLIDHYRKRSREDRKLTLMQSSKPVEDFTISLQDLSTSKGLELLRMVPERHRLILVLRYVNDLPVADIARLVGPNLSATQSLLVRARQSLEQTLSEVRDA